MKDQVSIRIKTLRKRRNLSQEQLAEMTGRSADAISAIERGKSFPNYETIELLAKALEVQVQDFFADVGNDVSNERRRMMVEITDILRGLSDDELSLAADMLGAFERKKDQQWFYEPGFLKLSG